MSDDIYRACCSRILHKNDQKDRQLQPKPTKVKQNKRHLRELLIYFLNFMGNIIGESLDANTRST